jgi:transposase
MARYKHYDYAQTKMLPVSFDRQILPGTFEHTLNYLIDEKVDLSVFEARYKNDASGAPAYDPAILLKIILFAYSKGIIYSRRIEQLARENVVCMALSADTVPHFTTIASFVSSLSAQITAVFRNVLLVCDEAGLIGKEMFAIDGVKLPSNASKEWSGTKADLQRKAQKMRRAIEHIVDKHRNADAADVDAPMQAALERQKKTLSAAIEKIEGFLATHEDKRGSSGKPKQSNITDNESAKMKTNKGVIQGYNGIAIADARHQVIVQAQAFGEGQEQALLVPMLEQTRETFESMEGAKHTLRTIQLSADAGYSSEANAQYLAEHGIDGYIADTLFRRRDPRFQSAERHKPTRLDEPFAKPTPERVLFQPADFRPAKDMSHCLCPAGQRLHRNGKRVVIQGRIGTKFKGSHRSCRDCALRARCLRHPDRTPYRQVVFFRGFPAGRPEKHLDRMKRKIDSEMGRYRYSRRLGIIEPVFGNLRHTKRLNRFTLRGRRKVSTQWQLYCLVHNIEKLQRYGRLDERVKMKRRRKCA